MNQKDQLQIVPNQFTLARKILFQQDIREPVWIINKKSFKSCSTIQRSIMKYLMKFHHRFSWCRNDARLLQMAQMILPKLPKDTWDK